MRIAIASDHAGFCQKADIKAFAEGLGHEVIDLGPENEDRVDYPDFADRAARMVASGKVDRAILICGTGLGMAITADKVAGVRAVPIQTPEFADLARRHNNANVVCLSGRFVDEKVNEEVVRTFLDTEFEGGRHATRVAKIMREDDPAFPGVEGE